MTMHQALKQWCSWDGVFVPAPGEIIIDKHNNRLKIGDGKTDFADLPYIDDNPSEPQLSLGAKAFIEDHIELLENNDYETFYSLIKTTALAREVSKALFKAGLNPKDHLKKCPKGCESIFYTEGKDDPNETTKNRDKMLYRWITTPSNSGKSWGKYVMEYDLDKEIEYIKKEIDYLQTWTLEDDE